MGLFWNTLGEGNGNPLQYSCLENPMDRRAWWAAVHGVTKSQTRLNDFTLTFHFHALEKEMATPSSALAWRIPGTGEPGGLPSTGSHWVGHDWSTLAAAVAMTQSQRGVRFGALSPDGRLVLTMPFLRIQWSAVPDLPSHQWTFLSDNRLLCARLLSPFFGLFLSSLCSRFCLNTWVWF